MPAHEILVHIERPTARARYAVQQMLGTLLGWTVVLEDDASRFAAAQGPKLVYGTKGFPDAFHVTPAGLLEEEGMHAHDPEVIEVDGSFLMFHVDGDHLPFDPFSAAFFLLTRYEEISGVDRDEHGRPIASRLHGSRHGYMDRPVVDEWALILEKAWRVLHPDLPRPQRSYRFVNTIDLDNGFKYLGRPLWRSLGSMVRDIMRGAWSEVPRRMRVIRGSERDPFDIYERSRSLIQCGAHRVVFFVLSAPRGKWDHAVPVTYGPYAERLRGLSKWAEVGLHPSYRSSEEEGLSAREASALEAVITKSVRITRQHFLRMRLPETYRELEAMGIEEEHSMGLHERLGFRAGTCTPYQWYDLREERSTSLVVHPFAVMDNTLFNKLKLDPQEAVARTAQLIERVKAVKGTFNGIWHESFLAEGKAEAPQREAIHRIMELARP